MSPLLNKTWSRVGETPIITAPFGHEHLSVIGGLTLEGSLYIQIHPTSIGADGVVTFLRHLLNHVPTRMLVLWDGARIHRSRVLSEFRQLDLHGRLVVEYFPSYAPELDPQEYVWHQLKHVDLRNLSSNSLDELWIHLRRATKRLRHRVGLLKNLTRYAGLDA